MKKMYVFFLIIIMCCSSFLLSACSDEFIDICIIQNPDKTIYEIGEELDLTGLVVKAIKTDSAMVKIYVNINNISGFDNSSAGQKNVVVEYDDFSTSFNVFVANTVATTQSDLQTTIQNANNNDIIKLSNGIYKGDDYKNIEVNKPLTIVGESKEKTEFHGNFLVGATIEGNNINEVLNIEKVSFYNINFQLDNNVTNNTINFEGNYVASENLAAIQTFSSKSITIINCGFKNYPFGILCNNADGLIVLNNSFDSLYLGGVKTLTSSKNIMIAKNYFINIATNILISSDTGEQEYLATISLAFNKTEVAGITIYDNAITKMALKTGEWLKFNDVDNLLESNEVLDKYNYVNNTAAIILYSTSEDNLPVFGIAVAKNSFGSSLNNLLYGLGTDHNINASAVLFNY